MTRLCAAVVGLLTCIPASGPGQAEREATVRYVQTLQATDGGFRSVRPAGVMPRDGTSLRATLGAVRALKYFGGEPRNREACLRFIDRCRDGHSGGFANVPGGAPDVVSTALGIMAIVDLKRPLGVYEASAIRYLSEYLREHAAKPEEIRMAAAAFESLGRPAPRASEWLDQLRRARNGQGTYGAGDGTARETGSAVVTILRLGGALDDRAILLKTLRAGQRSDGGFGKEGAPHSDLESCYRVVRAFAMLKEKPADVEALRRFVGRCRNTDGGYGVQPGQPSNVGATYYAGIVLHWLGE